MNWKLTAIILIFVILALSFVLYEQQTETYNFGNFEIEKSQFDSISSTIGEKYELFTICNIAEDNCIRIGKLE